MNDQYDITPAFGPDAFEAGNDEEAPSGLLGHLIEDCKGGVACPTIENLERVEERYRKEAEKPLDLDQLMREAMAAHRMVDGKTLWMECRANSFEDGWYDPSTFAAGPFENTLDGVELAWGWWKKEWEQKKEADTFFTAHVVAYKEATKGSTYSSHVVAFKEATVEDIVVGYEGTSDTAEMTVGVWEAEELGAEDQEQEYAILEETMDYLLKHDLVQELKARREERHQKMVVWLNGELSTQTLQKAWRTFWRKLITSRQRCSRTGLWQYVWLTKTQAKEVEAILRRKLGK